MDLETLLAEIKRPCTTFELGGFRPTHALEESWLGSVTRYLPDEEIPIDQQGKPMVPLGQFYLPGLPYVPSLLSDVALLTVFSSTDFEGEAELMDGCWEVREYTDPSKLVVKQLPPPPNALKAFPLQAKLKEADYPVWDGGGLTDEQEDAFIALENEGIIEDFFDVAEHQGTHKVGGYPTFCQPGPEGEMEPYQFMFQIASDPKLQFNVVDGGVLSFWKHPTDGTWKLYYDFF